MKLARKQKNDIKSYLKRESEMIIRMCQAFFPF